MSLHTSKKKVKKTQGKIGPCGELFGTSHHISSPSHPCSTAPEQASSTSSSSPSRAESDGACCQCTTHVENAALAAYPAPEPFHVRCTTCCYSCETSSTRPP
jgi:hypothetical protein